MTKLGESEMQKKGQKVEVEMVHPWPEWIELMERLVQQNYFDHKRRDDEKMVEDLGFDMTNVVEEVRMMLELILRTTRLCKLLVSILERIDLIH
ncbi:hypothetical protein ES332_A06G096100v1 [Gossypium tomentosum]|uniref:Uncharacterized protein n=1 Tax=Gossypium tomentosum TaxID=34277 RepID=A0A5D2Q431_GOSTO|nr:hypothetical protein ES332_A06G096100v1 [Gossypium tomentosum]